MMNNTINSLGNSGDAAFAMWKTHNDDGQWLGDPANCDEPGWWPTHAIGAAEMAVEIFADDRAQLDVTAQHTITLNVVAYRRVVAAGGKVLP